MKRAWYILSVFVFFDCMQGVNAGNISGLGIIDRVKFVTIVNYWVIGIPISFYLAFRLHMALEGLWYGPTMAVFLNYCIYEYEIRQADWE
jgi:MATE family multidrug resistance protein